MDGNGHGCGGGPGCSGDGKRRPLFFYVDFENTGTAAFDGLDLLGADDTVVVMYSPASAKVGFRAVERMLACPARHIIIRARNGMKDALDFQLITVAMLNAARCPADLDHVIVSRDGGYDYAIGEAGRMGYGNIFRAGSVMEGLTAVACRNGECGDLVASLARLGIVANDAVIVGNALRVCSTKDSLYSSLCRSFGATYGRDVYVAVRSDLAHLRTLAGRAGAEDGS